MKKLIYILFLIPLSIIGQIVPFGFMEESVASGTVPVIETFTQTIYASGSITFVVNKPSGDVSGDLLLIMVANADLTTTSQWDATSDPAGWTFVKEGGDTQSDAHMAFFWKISNGSESSTFTITGIDAARPGWIACVRISGVHTTPLGTIGATYISNLDTAVITGITTANDNSLVIYQHSKDESDQAPFTTPSGWTEGAEMDDPSEDAGGTDGVWGYKAMPTAGATGTASITGSAGADGVIGWIFEIRSE